MKSRKTISAVAFALLLVVSTLSSLAARNGNATNTNTKHHHYKLEILPILGGTFAEGWA